ncbi:MAG TPA: hypothetical protein DCY13_05855 [Verrucomicrobiales bacterium]|nr:hypothetical protein [Verrucomicrobiales bacterium]
MRKSRFNGTFLSAAHGLLLLFALLSGPLSADAATLTASFNRESLVVGQPAVLSVTFEGGTPGAPPAVPQLEGAQAYFNGQSTQWRSVNGVATVTQSFNYYVQPLRAGELRVPSITATVDGQQVTSQPIVIKVLSAEEAQSAEQQALSRLAWVEVELPETEAYLGEVVPALIKVYATAAEQLQLHQFKAEGFTLGKAQNTLQSREVINNQAYHVVTFHMPIAARKIGRLPVGPAECTLNVQVPVDGRTRTDPFAQLDMFGRYQVRPMRITSEVEHLNVLPLPTNNVPTHFNGAVGQFAMNVTAGPTNLAAGDPITFKVEIQATGTLDDLRLPEQTGWREFKTYPATAQIMHKDPLGMAGVKVFEQVVVPNHAEIRELPPFLFSYFDPDAGEYRTLTRPAIALNIRPNAAQSAQPTFASGSQPPQQAPPEPPREDIAHIEPRLGAMATGSVVWIRQPWFYVAQLVPIGAWLGALLWRRRQQALARDPRLLRRRQVDQLVQTGLKELRLLADRGETAAFYETTLRLLKEQLGERLDLPGVSITESVIDERLRPLGMPDDLRQRLHGLFQTCNHARYAGQQSAADLGHSLAELESLLAALRKLPSA